jgi:hypothetical protein
MGGLRHPPRCNAPNRKGFLEREKNTLEMFPDQT